MRQNLLLPIKELGHLFFPRTCASCRSILISNEEAVCISCFADLPFTGFNYTENALVRQLKRKVEILGAAALLYFEKGSLAQTLVHSIKYGGNKAAAISLGRLFSSRLAHSAAPSFDLVVPVPMHTIKLRRRGFNQAEAFADGIAEISNLKVETDYIKRINSRSGQTEKNRNDRLQLVNSDFKVESGAHVNGKCILLVDDVITTGATIETCARLLTEAGARVWVASICWTSSLTSM